MKTKLTLVLITCLSFFATAQIDFQEIIIIENSDDVDQATFACVGDIDGDGDLDAISTALNGKVYWFKNTDGQGAFTQYNIVSDMTSTTWCDATDIDGDGDADIVISIFWGIYWCENTDGLGINWTTHTLVYYLPESEYMISSTMLVDIDGDGDKDLLYISLYDPSTTGYLKWKENDGEGNFSDHSIASYVLDRCFATDIDGDGDMDVISNGEGLYWFENINGEGSFGVKKLISVGEFSGMFPVDIDGDGDIDLFSYSDYNGIHPAGLYWYENDGLGTFIEHQIDSTDYIYFLYSDDFDNDGDMDVIATFPAHDKIAWYENIDGQGNFSTKQIISTNLDRPISAIAADIDADGSIDILTASYDDDKIAWFRNSPPVGLPENSLLDFSVFPNPATGIIHIQTETELVLIQLFNNLGQLVLEKSLSNEFDFSHLSQGVYICKATAKNGDFGIREIIKN